MYGVLSHSTESINWDPDLGLSCLSIKVNRSCIKVLLTNERDAGPDPSKEFASGLLVFLHKLIKNESVDALCCDVDVASILTVRLAAVLAAHWHRLPSIGAWGIAMLADISESANVSASTEAGMKTTLKTLQAKSKQPGQGGLMNVWLDGGSFG